jgi:hypothetical protein
MPNCSVGISGAKAGIQPRIYFDTAFMGSILPVQLQWMKPFLPYLPPIYLNTDTYCLNDRPQYPNLVEATFAALLAGDQFGATAQAAGLVTQAVLAGAWDVLCECKSVATPPPPSPPVPPVNLPVLNPTSVTTTCLYQASPKKVQNAAGGEGNIFGGPSNADNVQFKIPNNATGVHFVLHSEGTPGIGTYNNEWTYYPYGLDNKWTTLMDFHQNTVPETFNWTPANFAPGGFNLGIADTGTMNADNRFWAEVTVQCNSGPQNGTPCCTDPAALAMLVQLKEMVTLIQRQNVPFSSVPGIVHAGLTGTGNIEIQGLLGASVNLTTLPPWLGTIAGTPDRIFDAGYVTFGTDDGYDSTFRITHQAQVYLPPRASAFTDLGFSLGVGVTATITELLREP